MADHGLHVIHPARRAARMLLQYPWSVLWVLTAALLALGVTGQYILIVIIVGLQAVILLHSMHLDRERRRRRR